MKRILNISIWVLFIIGILVLLSFTQSKKRNSVCNLKVTVDNFSGNHFVTEDRVKNILKNLGFKEGVDRYKEIDTEKLERKLMGISSVESVEMFKNLNGTLEVNVIQRKPIARIFNKKGGSLYIDDKGKTMQVSDYFTSRVLVVNGNINVRTGEDYEAISDDIELRSNSRLDEVYEMADYISKNKFLKAQIEQIYVEKNEEVILIPKVGNQEIIFGEVKNIEKKFEKLILFYKKGINPNNLNLYKTINLKFDNQIVCKKNK